MKIWAFLLSATVLASCTKEIVKTVETENGSGGGSPSSSVGDHQVGNGGGGICIAGGCVTITEAGLRIRGPQEQFTSLDPQTIQALVALAEKVPFGDYRQLIIAKAIGTGSTFKRLEIVDPEKLEVIRQRYLSVLRRHNPALEDADFQLFAFAGRAGQYSSEYFTYLLPSFFQLSPQQQAKILIHEMNVRPPTDEQMFLNVLELDGFIEDLAGDLELFMKPDFRMDRWTYLLSSVVERHSGSSMDYKKSSVFAWIHWYFANKNYVFDNAKFCSGNSTSFCTPDMSVISRYYNISAPAARVFSDIDGVLFIPEKFFPVQLGV
jgi:hypothetical protein